MIKMNQILQVILKLCRPKTIHQPPDKGKRKKKQHKRQKANKPTTIIIMITITIINESIGISILTWFYDGKLMDKDVNGKKIKTLRLENKL